MTRLIRETNRNIEKDNLWKGRFYVRQVGNAEFIRYDDKSGAELYVKLECVDRKTGKTYIKGESVNHWRIFNGSNLFGFMNWFIVDFVKVWDENPRPE